MRNIYQRYKAEIGVVLPLLLLGMPQVSVGNHFQGPKVNISVENGTLSDLFEQAQAQSDYLLFYNDALLTGNQAKGLTLNMKGVGVTEVLDKALQGRGYSYKVAGRQIVIVANEESLPVSQPTVVAKPAAVGTIVQSGTVVTGTVTDEKGAVLPGVTVMVKGTQRGTASDNEGNFTIEVPSEATLVFRYIGYDVQEVKVNNQAVLQVTMQLADAQLSEVVVTGYTTQEKRSVTGAMSSIKGETIENMPVQTVDRAIQGQVSGVNVMAANGVPGGPVRISIRGTGSITAGNEPLYIVDGVQLNTSTTSGQTASNPLGFLNTNDIESIEILKDGAAASIYGAQAANGVILVTTKKGKAGKTQFNLNYFTGITSPMPEVAMMNSQQFLQSRFEARNNRYPTRTAERNRVDVLNSAGLPTDLSDAAILALPTYNWQDAAFRTGVANNIELSASGGNDKTTFFLSGSYNKTDGNIIGIDFERATAKATLTHQASKRLNFGYNLNLSSVTQNGTSGSNGSTGAYAAPQYSAPMILPFIPIYLPDGSMNAPIEGFPGSSNRNPIQETVLHTLQSRTKTLLSSIYGNYQILDGLSFRSFYGLDLRFIDDERYVDPRTRSGAASQGSLSVAHRENMNFITSQTLSYNKALNKDHNLSGLLGAEFRNDVREQTSVSATGFTTHQFRTLQSAAVIGSASGSWTGFRRLGFFGQANYDYQKKYLLSAVLRYDGSSRFGANNKFGWFPAISAGWNAHEENFLRDQSWLSQLKLRVGYGETGNDAIGNFDSRGLYGSSSSTNYNQEPGIQPSGIANTRLRWERNVTTNIGLDFGVFNGRISGSAEVFRRLSKDLLLDRPVPYLSGFSSVTSNVGELKNEGVEFDVRTVNINTGGFQWRTNFNISFLRNKVLRLLDDDQVLPGDQSVRVGYSLGTNFTAHYAGVNSATGRPMWYDANGEITYNPLSPGDFKVFGNRMSSYFGGFTNSFSYKGFSLDVFFHYDYGRELSNAGMNSRWYSNGTDTRNSLERIYLNRWQEPGQLTTVPRPFDGGAEVNGSSGTMTSSRFLEDASFIRLKQVSLSYEVPAHWVGRGIVRSMRVYAQGVNLLTWTKWTGYDPEIIIDSGDFSSSQGTIPQTKAYTLGVQIGF